MSQQIIKVGEKEIQAFEIQLQSKKLILLRGTRGYVMCGYLNIAVADKFNDTAVIVTGVSSIAEAVQAKAQSVSVAAQKMGIQIGQSVTEILPLIA